MLRNVLNLGPKSEQMLLRAGITTLEDLRRLGAVKAYLAVKQAGCRPSRNLIWAVAGALDGIRWNQLPQETRERLKAELFDLLGQEN